MITYLIKSGLCLTLVLLVYKVLLERERIYVFNRYYLLFGLCFAFIVPFIPIVSSVAIPLVENNSAVLIENAEAVPMTILQQEVSNPISWTLYMVGLYAIGCLFFFSRFTSNIYKIFQKITKNTKAFYKRASLVLLDENVLPHTFLHYIFLEKEAYDTKNIADELYTHELAHVSQKHTLDIILIELIQIIFWFNPLLIYYKKAIQLNHEFLADDAVLKSNTKIPAYQQLLLENASWNHNLYLASNLNFSVTKKRLQMMTKHTSRVRAWLIASLTIPIFMGALFLFSTKVIAKETTTTPFESIETEMITEKDPKGSYFKNATFIFEDEKGNKTTKTYAELTDEEKAGLIPPPKTPSLQAPTKGSLKHWGNKEKFAVWVDEKVIDNTEALNYDIVHYTLSFIHKNARSSHFPQEHQIHLYTAAGFEALKKKLASPLPKGAVLRFKKGSDRVHLDKKKASATHNKKIIKNAQQELTKVYKSNTIHNKKDIVIVINKNGQYLVNYEHSCDLNGLNKFIKIELSKIMHKKARTALIIYDDYDKNLASGAIANAQKALKQYKIYDVALLSSADVPQPPPPPPPPPPPAPIKSGSYGNKDINLLINKDKKFLVNDDYVAELKGLDKFIKLELSKILHKKNRTASIRYNNVVSKDFVNKAVAILKSNEIYDITIQTSNSEDEIRLPPPPPVPAPPPALSAQETKDLERMHKNIKGHELKTMMIDGKKYYYIIKNDYKYIYNEKSQLVDENGKPLPPPPPPPKQKKKG